MNAIAWLLLAASIACQTHLSDAFTTQPQLHHSHLLARHRPSSSALLASRIPRLDFPDLPRHVLRKHDPLNYLVYVEDELEPKPKHPSLVLQRLMAQLKHAVFDEMFVTDAGVNATIDEIEPFLRATGGTVRVVSADQERDIVTIELGGTLAAKPANPSLRAAVVKEYLRTRLMFRPKLVAVDKGFERLTLDTVDDVLEGIRQFVVAAGGRSLVAESLETDKLVPVVRLRLDAPDDVRDLLQQEATMRLQRIFWSPKITVEWLRHTRREQNESEM